LIELLRFRFDGLPVFVFPEEDDVEVDDALGFTGQALTFDFVRRFE
jgi:hypothetical protein